MNNEGYYKGYLRRVFCNAFFSTILLISMNVVADGCPDITTLGAIPDSPNDAAKNTNIINVGLVANKCISIPKGVFWVSVQAGGIIVSSGNTIKGVNSESSILIARESVTGAVIKRKTPVNSYVTGVKIQDIAVILNQGFYNTQNPEMVGIDFTQITGSYISNVYVGTILVGEAITTAVAGVLTFPNSPPPEPIVDVYIDKKHLVQGIGIKLCTVPGQPYGGERNLIEKTKIWGARIGVSIDDTRCPNSGAHGTIVRDSDIQTVEYAIAQQSTSTTGITLSANHIQDLRPGGNNPSTMLAAYILNGSASSIQGGYIEAASTNPMKVLYLGNNAHGIKADLGYVSMGPTSTTFTPLGQLIRMAGYRNQVSCYDQFVSGNWFNLTN